MAHATATFFPRFSCLSMSLSAAPSSPFQRLRATHSSWKKGWEGRMSNPLGTATTIPRPSSAASSLLLIVMVFNLHLQFSSSCSITTSGAKIAYGTSRSRFRVRTGPQAAAEGKNRGEARADSLPWFCFFRPLLFLFLVCGQFRSKGGMQRGHG